MTLIALVMLWQQWRYQVLRRNLAQDRQRLLHSGNVFHVIVFFKLKSGCKLIDTARQYTKQVLADSRIRLIYAGQAAYSVSSQQLGTRDSRSCK